uniref:Uncharacterized protein LOC104219715 n=1 Tax=Nicotiana sylvestris TaxID=4096 RepID=A0A1U7W396_NICSY|nr:PREDICTED: uncharacterized protein LOC104219715 [Nicotiana sylvestris]
MVTPASLSNQLTHVVNSGKRIAIVTTTIEQPSSSKAQTNGTRTSKKRTRRGIEQLFSMWREGNTPSTRAIERFIANQWINVHKPKVLFHNDGYFIIMLNNSEEREDVMLKGPYTINSRPIIIRPWSENFDFNEEVLKITPLWAKLPKLPLNYWRKQALNKIGSGLGKPLYVDACTTVAERVSYARVLIEMDVTRPLSEKIKLYDHRGKVNEQIVQLDWKPQYCQT